MGEIVPSARHRAVIISIIVMMKPSPLRGLSAPTTSFTLLASGQEISSGYVEDNTRSKIHCALKCLKLSDCTAFCSNVSSAGCYLQSHSGSSFVQLPVNTVGTRCYARGEAGLCPLSSGYSLFESRCLKVINEGKRYADAQSHCVQDGGHLYHYKTIDKDTQAIVDLFQTGVGNKGKYWVGADDLVTEGQFLWSDESSLPIDDPVWVSGEPNGRSNENCVQIYTDPNKHVTRRYRLNDARCSGEISFVCQIDI